MAETGASAPAGGSIRRASTSHARAPALSVCCRCSIRARTPPPASASKSCQVPRARTAHVNGKRSVRAVAPGIAAGLDAGRLASQQPGGVGQQGREVGGHQSCIQSGSAGGVSGAGCHSAPARATRCPPLTAPSGSATVAVQVRPLLATS